MSSRTSPVAVTQLGLLLLVFRPILHTCEYSKFHWHLRSTNQIRIPWQMHNLEDGHRAMEAQQRRSRVWQWSLASIRAQSHCQFLRSWCFAGWWKEPTEATRYLFFPFWWRATLSWISPAVDFGFHSVSLEANFTSKTDLSVIVSIFVLPAVSFCLLLNPAPFTMIQRGWEDLDLLCLVQLNRTQTQFLLRLAPACLTLDHPRRREKRHGGWLEPFGTWRSSWLKFWRSVHCTEWRNYKIKLSVNGEGMT